MAAVGRSGCVGIDIDEATSGPDRWQIELDCHGWSLRFEIGGPAAAQDWLRFVDTHDGKTRAAELVIGSFLGVPVNFIKDDEFADRFFLVITGEHRAEFVFTANEVEAVRQVLRQVNEDLTRAA